MGLPLLKDSGEDVRSSRAQPDTQSKTESQMRIAGNDGAQRMTDHYVSSTGSSLPAITMTQAEDSVNFEGRLPTSTQTRSSQSTRLLNARAQLDRLSSMPAPSPIPIMYHTITIPILEERCPYFHSPHNQNRVEYTAPSISFLPDLDVDINFNLSRSNLLQRRLAPANSNTEVRTLEESLTLSLQSTTVGGVLVTDTTNVDGSDLPAQSDVGSPGDSAFGTPVSFNYGRFSWADFYNNLDPRCVSRVITTRYHNSNAEPLASFREDELEVEDMMSDSNYKIHDFAMMRQVSRADEDSNPSVTAGSFPAQTSVDEGASIDQIRPIEGTMSYAGYRHRHVSRASTPRSVSPRSPSLPEQVQGEEPLGVSSVENEGQKVETGEQEDEENGWEDIEGDDSEDGEGELEEEDVADEGENSDGYSENDRDNSNDDHYYTVHQVTNLEDSQILIQSHFGSRSPELSRLETIFTRGQIPARSWPVQTDGRDFGTENEDEAENGEMELDFYEAEYESADGGDEIESEDSFFDDDDDFHPPQNAGVSSNNSSYSPSNNQYPFTNNASSSSGFCIENKAYEDTLTVYTHSVYRYILRLQAIQQSLSSAHSYPSSLQQYTDPVCLEPFHWFGALIYAPYPGQKKACRLLYSAIQQLRTNIEMLIVYLDNHGTPIFETNILASSASDPTFATEMRIKTLLTPLTTETKGLREFCNQLLQATEKERKVWQYVIKLHVGYHIETCAEFENLETLEGVEVSVYCQMMQ